MIAIDDSVPAGKTAFLNAMLGERLLTEVDWAAEETAISLEYNGVGHAVMMATPEALEDLGLGFSLSEGIVEGAHELLDLELHAHPHGLRIAMQISAKRFAALARVEEKHANAYKDVLERVNAMAKKAA